MVHHTNSGIPLGDTINDNLNEDVVFNDRNISNLYIPGNLKRGDIYTHTFSRNAGSNCSIFDSNTQRVRKSIERYSNLYHVIKRYYNKLIDLVNITFVVSK